MRILRFVAIVAGRLLVAILIVPFAFFALGILACVKAFGAAWSDSE